MLNEIKTLLNIDVKLMEQKLENGTVVSAEAFEKDNEIFIVTDDEKVAMPVGEYILEDGRLLVVEAEGVMQMFVMYPRRYQLKKKLKKKLKKLKI